MEGVPATLQDRQDFADLMTGWIHRELGPLDRLPDLLHPDARIEITWFECLAYDFACFTFPTALADIGGAAVAKHPCEYAALRTCWSSAASRWPAPSPHLPTSVSRCAPRAGAMGTEGQRQQR